MNSTNLNKLIKGLIDVEEYHAAADSVSEITVIPVCVELISYISKVLIYFGLNCTGKHPKSVSKHIL